MTERLADHTTLGVGGPAAEFVTATSTPDLIAAVDACDAAGEPVLLLGGGSNLLVADEGFPGTVVHIATRGVDAAELPGGGIGVTVAAGENWDAFVARTVAAGWAGLECLAGIPGLTGATPVQNVGAYGADVSQTIARVQVYDRYHRVTMTLSKADCRFGYRDSVFKQDPDHYVVLAVVFRLGVGGESEPLRYAELAHRLGLEPGDRAPVAAVRAAVLDLRAGKGMVRDPADHDTWSAGSFFTNPILTAAEADALPPEAPRYRQPDGTVKTSAAWLISGAGFEKGHGTPPATLSTKHSLALTNRGGATAADILALAREIRSGVEAAFGITLRPEPNLVGCRL
ncbi:UDP-N-acetylmuramate dehydrogenase [Propionicicella superfundia]|uniref:UDP-N-acetylmuramate dehydrogenase n=1 Tax=Propionicicella superfundia TaxID=348582 RepID=UPI00048C6857|nr:UDP-N-acetylmuramate dehydrogenase [Propionicicella superfundia]